jgi:hypothetical protein
MADMGCRSSADLEGLVKRTELSMLTIGTPLSQAKKQGGTHKLLPVLTTTSNSPDTFLRASAKAIASFGKNSVLGVFASLGFKR